MHTSGISLYKQYEESRTILGFCKLRILQKHYEDVVQMTKDSSFESNWKEQVEQKISTCGSMACEDDYLNWVTQTGKIEKCICKLMNSKTGGSDGLVGELLKYGRAEEWWIHFMNSLRLFGVRRQYLGSGERD